MIQLRHGEHSGMECVWISNGEIRLAVTTRKGPRAMFFGSEHGDNIFAELPDVVIPSKNGPYLLLGGHRLWHAPEWSVRTYWPETQTIQFDEAADGVTVTLPADGGGIVKTMSFAMDADKPKVTVTHTLRNEGLWPVQLAPWAITQCRLGGIVLLPQPVDPADPESLLPNKRYSFWPYTSFTDGRVIFGRAMTLLHAKAAPPTKLGYRNHDGWAGYWLNGMLFAKQFDPMLGANHPDFGCNCECYCNDRFVEIETLGPLDTLNPGASITHVETWRLLTDVPRPDTEISALGIAHRL